MQGVRKAGDWPLWASVLALLFCLGFALRATATAEVVLNIKSLRHPAFELDGLAVHLDMLRSSDATIKVAALRVAGSEYKGLTLVCHGFFYDGARMDCPNGTLQRAQMRGGERPPLTFSFSWNANGDFDFAIPETDMVSLSPLVKRLRAWQPTGRIGLNLQSRGKQATLTLAVTDAHFTDPGGQHRGSGVTALLTAQATQKKNGVWAWSAQVDWPQGQVVSALWTLPGGVRIDGRGELTPRLLDIQQARLSVRDVGAVNASLLWDREAQQAKSWGVVSDPLDIQAAAKDWITPWLKAADIPVWHAQGRALFAAEARAGAMQRIFAALDGVTVEDPTGAIRLQGLKANLTWEPTQENEGNVAIAGGQLGELPMGAVTFPIRIGPQSAAMTNLHIPMLDGVFDIDRLIFRKSATRWDGEFSGGVRSISMPKLTRALGWPEMAGSFTAAIPQVRVDQDTLILDGALSVEVFDGGLVVHQLRLENAFAKNRRVIVDVVARNLDLGMLTRTFSFGSIEGRFDADLRHLVLDGWQPIQFDAQVASSPGDARKAFSIGALKDISRLDKSGGLGALARMPERDGMRLNYEQIRLGCILRDGVCSLQGIRPVDKGGLLLMEGAGLPSINIIGYNPRIDWNAMITRLRAVIAGKTKVDVQ